MRILLVAAVSALLAAGCTGQAPAPATDDEPRPTSRTTDGLDEEAPPRYWVAENGAKYRTYNASGHVTADVAYIGLTTLIDTHARMRYDVPENATGLVAELRWTGAYTDFDLMVTTPKWCPGGTPVGPVDLEREACWWTVWATREGPGVLRADRGPGRIGPDTLRLDVSEAKILEQTPGNWTAFARNSVAVDADLTLRVTVFTELPPPPNFSALPKAR